MPYVLVYYSYLTFGIVSCFIRVYVFGFSSLRRKSSLKPVCSSFYVNNMVFGLVNYKLLCISLFLVIFEKLIVLAAYCCYLSGNWFYLTIIYLYTSYFSRLAIFSISSLYYSSFSILSREISALSASFSLLYVIFSLIRLLQYSS